MIRTRKKEKEKKASAGVGTAWGAWQRALAELLGVWGVGEAAAER